MPKRNETQENHDIIRDQKERTRRMYRLTDMSRIITDHIYHVTETMTSNNLAEDKAYHRAVAGLQAIFETARNIKY